CQHSRERALLVSASVHEHAAQTVARPSPPRPELNPPACRHHDRRHLTFIGTSFPGARTSVDPFAPLKSSTKRKKRREVGGKETGIRIRINPNPRLKRP